MHASPYRSRGIALTEVLVAVLVFCIGLLGLAQLQVAGLKSVHSSAQRLDAVSLAFDMLERIRSNAGQALDGGYDVALGTPTAAPGVAGEDLRQWKRALAAMLPQGDGAIEVRDRRVTLTVQWLDSSDARSASAVHLRTQL